MAGGALVGVLRAGEAVACTGIALGVQEAEVVTPAARRARGVCDREVQSAAARGAGRRHTEAGKAVRVACIAPSVLLEGETWPAGRTSPVGLRDVQPKVARETVRGTGLTGFAAEIAPFAPLTRRNEPSRAAQAAGVIRG